MTIPLEQVFSNCGLREKFRGCESNWLSVLEPRNFENPSSAAKLFEKNYGYCTCNRQIREFEDKNRQIGAWFRMKTFF